MKLTVFLVLTLTIVTKGENLNEQINKKFELIENVVRDHRYLALADFQKLVVLTSLYDVIQNKVHSSDEIEQRNDDISLRLKDDKKRPSTAKSNRIFIG